MSNRAGADGAIVGSALIKTIEPYYQKTKGTQKNITFVSRTISKGVVPSSILIQNFAEKTKKA